MPSKSKDAAKAEHIEVGGDPSELRNVREFVEGLAGAAGLGEKKMDQVVMAVDEACANIIAHSFSAKTKNKSIKITARHSEKAFSVLLESEGLRFDPTETRAEVDLDKHKKEHRTNGLGIYIMTRLMDEVRYSYVKRKTNCLELVKYLDG